MANSRTMLCAFGKADTCAERETTRNRENSSDWSFQSADGGSGSSLPCRPNPLAAGATGEITAGVLILSLFSLIMGVVGVTLLPGVASVPSVLCAIVVGLMLPARLREEGKRRREGIAAAQIALLGACISVFGFLYFRGKLRESDVLDQVTIARKRVDETVLALAARQTAAAGTEGTTVPLPPDPFGPAGALLLSRREPDGSVVIWSVGPDGVDDKAAAEYDPGRGVTSGGDIVGKLPAGLRRR